MRGAVALGLAASVWSCAARQAATARPAETPHGVAYLDDGTMVVVENGRRHINSDLDIVVTRVLQTVAGRMIFAHPKLPHGN